MSITLDDSRESLLHALFREEAKLLSLCEAHAQDIIPVKTQIEASAQELIRLRALIRDIASEEANAIKAAVNEGDRK